MTIQRQPFHELFPNTVMRMGGSPSAVEYHFECSQCHHKFNLFSKNLIPPEVIIKKMKQKGWLLGKQRRHDWCDKCLSIKPENKLASRFKVVSDGEEVPSVAEVVDIRSASRRATEASIAKHFGKPSDTGIQAGDNPDKHRVDTVVEPSDDDSTVVEEQMMVLASAMLDLQGMVKSQMPNMKLTLDLILMELTEIRKSLK